jgi:hypothetical protein
MCKMDQKSQGLRSQPTYRSNNFFPSGVNAPQLSKTPLQSKRLSPSPSRYDPGFLEPNLTDSPVQLSDLSISEQSQLDFLNDRQLNNLSLDRVSSYSGSNLQYKSNETLYTPPTDPYFPREFPSFLPYRRPYSLPVETSSSDDSTVIFQIHVPKRR